MRIERRPRHAVGQCRQHLRKRSDRESWTRDDGEMGVVENLRVIVPRGDVGEGVGADHEEQLGTQISALAKASERAGRIGRSFRAELHI